MWGGGSVGGLSYSGFEYGGRARRRRTPAECPPRRRSERKAPAASPQDPSGRAWPSGGFAPEAFRAGLRPPRRRALTGDTPGPDRPTTAAGGGARLRFRVARWSPSRHLHLWQPLAE